MDRSERQRLRLLLLAYPGISESNVEMHLAAYDEREQQKTELLARGLSNRLAEKWLDKSGYPRPPGWSSVFLYPDSSTPRLRYLLLLVVIAGFAVWFTL